MSENEELRAEVERLTVRYAQLLHAYVTLTERLRTADFGSGAVKDAISTSESSRKASEVSQ